jgi:hypothetical protein
MKPVVTSRPMPGTPYREHTVTLDGIELRSQMHAFTPEEIDEAVRLYREMGICTPRHSTDWQAQRPPVRKLPGGAGVPEPITYNGLFLED